MNKYFPGFLMILLLVGFSLLVFSCGSIAPFIGSVNTTLTSSSLAEAGVNAAVVNNYGSWEVTPSSISGYALSILFPINSQEDEGVVVFGDGRPDIAKAQSDLSYFSLDTSTKFSGTLSKKPGFVGGESRQIIMLFGYFDVAFGQGGVTKEVRMVYGDTGEYKRGDKLLKVGGEWKWYDTTAGTFVTTRPTSPSAVASVANFSDPVRTEMHYYFLGAELSPYLTFTNDLLDNYNLEITVDFDVTNAIIFPSVSSEASFDALSDADLIQKFDMKQNVTDWSDPGITCYPTMVSTLK